MKTPNFLGVISIALFLTHFSWSQDLIEMTCEEKAKVILDFESDIENFSPEHIDQMITYIEPCATKDNLDALYALGWLKFNLSSETEYEGYNLMNSASASGSGRASFKIGMLYYEHAFRFGQRNSDYKNAINYISKAGRQGFNKDVVNYVEGYFRMKGFSTSTLNRRNYLSAKSAFEHSNHPMAKHWLAVIHYFGLAPRFPQDKEKGLKMLTENDILNSQILSEHLQSQNNDWITLPAEEYAAVRYGINQHPVNNISDFNKLNTTHQGNFIEFDWSGSFVRRNVPFTLKLDIEETTNYAKNVQYQLTIDGNIFNGVGELKNHQIYFDNLTFPLKRLYKDHPDKDRITYKIDHIQLKEFEINQKLVYIAKEWKASIVEWGEPIQYLRMILRPNTSLNKSLEFGNSIVSTSFSDQKLDKDFAVISPNPIGDNFSIAYSLNETADVQVAIYDFYGKQKLSLPVQKRLTKGEQILHVDSSSLPSGTYVIQMTINESPYSKTVIKL
ncbi:T9SS type A sorting domain-containing protein [Aquimarina sp. 2201CG1-2-11]|uniref:T9SS type A sorting domain-containing protein n=1 Tax=Aquimarina discodermiae TaxID=3231043 RepID=UPI003461B073